MATFTHGHCVAWEWKLFHTVLGEDFKAQKHFQRNCWRTDNSKIDCCALIAANWHKYGFIWKANLNQTLAFKTALAFRNTSQWEIF